MMGNDEFDPKMLEILVCPLTQSRLTLSNNREELISPSAKLAFPIIRGVPIMTIEDARPLTEPERAQLKSTYFRS